MSLSQKKFVNTAERDKWTKTGK